MGDGANGSSVGGDRLVLVVHGIGEQLPGETVDMLVGGLTGDVACSVESERRMLREEDWREDQSEPRREVPIFPCDTRSVTAGGQRTDFAEVYWGDLSRGVQGRIIGLIELIQLIMGLGHIVRENLAARTDTAVIRPWLASAFVWLLHGPIVALNISFALAILSLGFWNVFIPPVGQGDALRITEPVPSLAMLTAAVLQFGIWWRLRKDRSSHLFNIFVGGQRVMAISLVVFVFLSHVVVPFLPVSMLDWLLSVVRVEQPLDCLLIAPGKLNGCYLFWYADGLIMANGVFWLAAVPVVFLLGVMQLCRDLLNGAFTENRTLYPATSAFMLVLWLFIALAVWVTGIKALSTVAWLQLETRLLTHSFNEAVSLAVFICGAVLALFMFGGVAAIIRFRAPGKHEKAGNPKLEYRAPRLIVARVFRAGLTFCVLFLVVGVALEAMRFLGLQWGPTSWLENEENRAWLFGLSVAFVTLTAVVYSYFRGALALAIGIAKDVMIWFIKKQWSGQGEDLYPVRRRILARFRTVYRRMMEAHDYENVVVVSHSQGTVIAFEALRRNGLRDALTARGFERYCAPDLVTMGSPISHIYGFYFAHEFAVRAEDHLGIGTWSNIFRTDDFVGMDVNVIGKDGKAENGWIDNIAVNSGGHTGYWIDDEVLTYLKPRIVPGLV